MPRWEVDMCFVSNPTATSLEIADYKCRSFLNFKICLFEARGSHSLTGTSDNETVTPATNRITPHVLERQSAKPHAVTSHTTRQERFCRNMAIFLGIVIAVAFLLAGAAAFGYLVKG